MRSVEHGEVAIRITMHPHLDLHVMHPVAVLGDLQGHPLEGHAVVFADDTLEGQT